MENCLQQYVLKRNIKGKKDLASATNKKATQPPPQISKNARTRKNPPKTQEKGIQPLILQELHTTLIGID